MEFCSPNFVPWYVGNKSDPFSAFDAVFLVSTCVVYETALKMEIYTREINNHKLGLIPPLFICPTALERPLLDMHPNTVAYKSEKYI